MNSNDPRDCSSATAIGRPPNRRDSSAAQTSIASGLWSRSPRSTSRCPGICSAQACFWSARQSPQMQKNSISSCGFVSTSVWGVTPQIYSAMNGRHVRLPHALWVLYGTYRLPEMPGPDPAPAFACFRVPHKQLLPCPERFQPGLAWRWHWHMLPTTVHIQCNQKRANGAPFSILYSGKFTEVRSSGLQQTSNTYPQDRQIRRTLLVRKNGHHGPSSISLSRNNSLSARTRFALIF